MCWNASKAKTHADHNGWLEQGGPGYTYPFLYGHVLKAWNSMDNQEGLTLKNNSYFIIVIYWWLHKIVKAKLHNNKNNDGNQVTYPVRRNWLCFFEAKSNTCGSQRKLKGDRDTSNPTYFIFLHFINSRNSRRDTNSCLKEATCQESRTVFVYVVSWNTLFIGWYLHK